MKAPPEREPWGSINRSQRFVHAETWHVLPSLSTQPHHKPATIDGMDMISPGLASDAEMHGEPGSSGETYKGLDRLPIPTFKYIPSLHSDGTEPSPCEAS